MSPAPCTTTPSASTIKTAPPCTPTGQTTLSLVSLQSSSASSPAPVESEVLAESQVPDESDASVSSSVFELESGSSATSSSLWSPPPNSLFPSRVHDPVLETPSCQLGYYYGTESPRTSIIRISAADIPNNIPGSDPFKKDDGGNKEPYPTVTGTKHPIRRSWFQSSASPTPLDFLSPERLGGNRRSSGSGSGSEDDSTSCFSSPTTPRAKITIASGRFGDGVSESTNGGSEESDDELAGDGSGNGETSAVVPTWAVPPAGLFFGLPRTNFFGRLNASVFAMPTAGTSGNQDDANELAEEVDAHEEFPAAEEDKNHHDTAEPATVGGSGSLHAEEEPSRYVEGEGEVEEEAVDEFAGTKTVKRAAPKQLSSPKKKVWLRS
ncbi:hypothetical protein C8F01DRAFT_1198972 [Mycena amicta]|nr:hypothetical protein C8F01DRAFT_1198972 [Mycena amicta]